MASGHLTLKDMIEGSGCTPRTVRYYEREGLLRAARSAGGHRLFEPSELERLNFVISLREAGWSLEEITTFLSIRDSGDVSDHDKAEGLMHLVVEQIDRLERKIAVLHRLRDDLQATRDLMNVCLACTELHSPARCQDCDRVPDAGSLPRSFRLTWRSDMATFDEDAAVEDDT